MRSFVNWTHLQAELQKESCHCICNLILQSLHKCCELLMMQMDADASISFQLAAVLKSLAEKHLRNLPHAKPGVPACASRS